MAVLQLDMSEYQELDKVLNFIESRGEQQAEVIGLPLSGTIPNPDTITSKVKVLFDPQKQGVMLVYQAHATYQSTLGRLVLEANIPAFAVDTPLPIDFKQRVQLGVMVKQFRGDTFGRINSYICNGEDCYGCDPHDAERTGTLASLTNDETTVRNEVQTSGARNFRHEFNGRLESSNALQPSDQTFNWWVWYPYILGHPLKTDIPIEAPCDICVIRVTGKQWPRDPQTTTTSSSGRNGSAHPYFDPRSKRLTRTASQEKVLIETKMAESQHSRTTTRSRRKLERQGAVIGFPL